MKIINEDKELTKKIVCKMCGDVVTAPNDEDITVCYSCAITELDRDFTNSEDSE